MSGPQVAFVAVATEGVYDDYARRLAASALDHAKFESFRFHILAGVEGPWPIGTLTRPRVMLDHWDEIVALGADYVYAIDADATIVHTFGNELLGEIVATQHPGYIGHVPDALPYDRSQISRAYVPLGEGEHYYAGGFYGGETDAVLDLLGAMAWILEGPQPRWHDESALNRCLIDSAPTKLLTPSFCFPDDSTYYERHVWPQDHGYQRVIVMLDKPQGVRGER